MKKIFVTLLCLCTGGLSWAADEKPKSPVTATKATESHNMNAFQNKLNQQIQTIMQILEFNKNLSEVLNVKSNLETEYRKILETDATTEGKKHGFALLREANEALISFQSAIRDNQDIIEIAEQIIEASNNTSDQNTELMQKIDLLDIEKLEAIKGLTKAAVTHIQNAIDQHVKLVASTNQFAMISPAPTAPAKPARTRWEGFVPQLVKQTPTGFWGRIKNLFWPQLPTLAVSIPTDEAEKTVIDATKDRAVLVDRAAEVLQLGNYNTSTYQPSIDAECKRLKSAGRNPAQAFELARQAHAIRLAQHYNSLNPEKLLEQTANARSWRVGLLSTGFAYLAASKIFRQRPLIAIPCAIASYYFIKPTIQFVCRGFLYVSNKEALDEMARKHADYLNKLKRTPFCVLGTDETERFLAQ